MTQDDMKRKIIDIVESTKLAGFDADTLHYDGKDGGFSNQKEGYYDTVSAVKELEALVNLAVIEARIQQLKWVATHSGKDITLGYELYEGTGLENLSYILQEKQVKSELSSLTKQKQALTGEGE